MKTKITDIPILLQQRLRYHIHGIAHNNKWNL